jgi:flagellum-specific ATP synthase
MMIQAGLYAKGSDPMVDAAIKIWPALDGFLAEDAPEDGIAGSFSLLAKVLGPR